MNSHQHGHAHHSHHHTSSSSHSHAPVGLLTQVQTWLQTQSFLALSSWQRVLCISPVLVLLWLGVWWAAA